MNSFWGTDPSLYTSLSREIWPSCFEDGGGEYISPASFNKTVSKTIQLDVRSLYPTAQTKKQPLLNGVLLTAANKNDAYLLNRRKKIRKNGVLAINQVCQRVRDSNIDDVFLVPINNYKIPRHRFEEYYACRLFMQKCVKPLIKEGYKLLTVAGASYTGEWSFKLTINVFTIL